MVFFYGLFLLLFVISITLFSVIRWKKEFFTNRLIVTSLSLSVFSLIYAIWFTVFFAVLWIGGAVVHGSGSESFRYDLGAWIILFIVLFPLLFFSFVGNTIWFVKLTKKNQTI